MENKKTIFILISRGFIVRNILRSGVLDLLKKVDYKIIIFFIRPKDGPDLPVHLQEEFNDDQVSIEVIGVEKLASRSYKIFFDLTKFLIYTKHTWSWSQMGTKSNLKKNPFRAELDRIIFWPLSRIGLLKRIVRWFEQKYFTVFAFSDFFEKYNPDLIFSTSVVCSTERLFMREARSRGIPIVSMPKGWDNVTRVFYRIVPDALILQNEQMKKAAIKYQKIPEKNIHVTGFPQFDWYVRKDLIRNRDEYLSSLGLDPNRKLIFYGSEGKWAPDDKKLIDLLVSWINEPNKLAVPSSLIIRAHYSDVKENRYKHFQNIENVAIDTSHNISDFFSDNWDPDKKEIIQFTNAMYHMDIMIAVASTLTLDGVCFDKPLINVAFDVLYKNGKDFSHMLYNKNFYHWVLETGAVDLVSNKGELLKSLNDYLLDPKKKEKERQVLLDKLCYKVDGRSSERIFEVIDSLVKKSN